MGWINFSSPAAPSGSPVREMAVAVFLDAARAVFGADLAAQDAALEFLASDDAEPLALAIGLPLARFRARLEEVRVSFWQSRRYRRRLEAAARVEVRHQRERRSVLRTAFGVRAVRLAGVDEDLAAALERAGEEGP